MSIKNNTAALQGLLDAVNSLPNAGGEQATPVISVSSNGLITATAGTKSTTHQLAFQAAKTITPSTVSQIAVSSGYYTGGSITVAAVPTQSKTVTPTSTTQNITPDSGKFLSKVTVNGDSDLVAGNIKSGVNIFGVTGTYEGSGGGDEAVVASIIDRTIQNYENSKVTNVGAYAFYSCYNLNTVNLPSATGIGSHAFVWCIKLTDISFPKATYIYTSAFARCSSLASAIFPNVKTIESYAFQSCSRMTTISFPLANVINSSAFDQCYSLRSANFPNATKIGSYIFEDCSSLAMVSLPKIKKIPYMAFYNCYNLKSLYLMGSTICKLEKITAFQSTPINGYSTSAGTYGSIYVPASLLTSYKAATNWAILSSRFVGI